MKHAWIVVVGIVLLAIGQLISEVMPVIGRVAFQAAAAGSYSPNNYEMNLVVFNQLAILLVVIGVLSVAFELRRRGNGKGAIRKDGDPVASSPGADSADSA